MKTELKCYGCGKLVGTLSTGSEIIKGLVILCSKCWDELVLQDNDEEVEIEQYDLQEPERDD